MSAVKSFDSAYPGSMFERRDGYYVERNDHKSMAAALVELIASRDRELEDLREAVASYQRLTAASPFLLDAVKHAIRFHDQLTPADIERYRAAVAMTGEQA